MGYRRVTVELLCAIRARLRAGESNREIAVALGIDKKTVNHYATKLGALGLPDELGFSEVLERLSSLPKDNRKPKPAFAALEPYADEIRSLIAGGTSMQDANREPMKAKTAWDVIRLKYALAGKTSYETFKRFVRDQGLTRPRTEAVSRIETEPGDETQIDYGKVGTRFIGERRRAVYAYCGRLSASRLPYIQYGTSQNEVAFAESAASMFSFYGGVTRRITLDNLKAGVIACDVYDPTINRTFAELCEHYGVLADPARVRSPKDKGKVERLVPLARELWKRLNALYPDASLDELNAHAREWCLREYGLKKHGTTGIPPLEAFERVERPCLRPLPSEPFVVASWTIAKVHPDQFIAVKGKYYGMPAAYIGKCVDVRSTKSLVTIFHDHKKVREYATNANRRHYLPDDFPPYAEPFKQGSYPTFLATKADNLSSQAGTYIRLLLDTGGNLALRRAQGCLAVIEQHRASPSLSHVLGHAIAHRVMSPDSLRGFFKDDERQNVILFPLSDEGKAMTRGADYYAGI